MHFSQKFFKVLHGSKERVDVPEILHIVAKVLHRRAVEWTDPHRLDVQVLKVMQLLLNPCHISVYIYMSFDAVYNLIQTLYCTLNIIVVQYNIVQRFI